ncbi:MAG: hypothetical protein K6G65_05885 [Lachnospiraceae bacterium]|nr:hypothetical protein [Lachnospiraceae bacterium]
MKPFLEYDKIIFVCQGNTCRSPMAEVIFRQLLPESRLEVESRGLVVLFPEPANPKADLVLKNHDMTIENHLAVQLEASDISETTLLITMTESQKQLIMSDYQTEDVATIKELAEEVGDVIDPYGGDVVDYENCYNDLLRLIKKIIIKITHNEEE